MNVVEYNQFNGLFCSEVYYYDGTVVKMNNINSSFTDIGQFPVLVSQIIAFASSSIFVYFLVSHSTIYNLYPRRQSGISGTF